MGRAMAADGLVCSFTPPPGWEGKCGECTDLFHSSAWQDVLREGFGCSSVYLWDSQNRIGCALPVFRIGPFRVAYLGFPAGGQIGGISAPESLLEALPDLSFRQRIDAIRVPVSAFAEPTLLASRAVALPETAINDLAEWDPQKLPGAVRRDLKKFDCSGLELRLSVDVKHDSYRYHRLYLGTIRRHRGRRRYTEAYFRALIKLSRASDQLRCIGAYAGDELAGYLVAALSGDTVYYLHGATGPRFQHKRPSDALLCDAIKWAREIGALHFNMMTSPRLQPGLVFYKEKWGGETGVHRTCTLPVSWLGRLAAPLLNRGAERTEQSVPGRG